LFQASICQIKSAAAAGAATAKPSIETLVEEHEHSCPHSDVPCTRQGHCPKWLLTDGKNKEGAVLRKTGCHVIKSGCLSHDKVQNLIISGDSIPMPVEFGEVVDGLETWGGIH